MPKDIGEKLAWQDFKNFKEFRNEFWEVTSASKYADQFSTNNLARMKQKNAPLVPDSQALGKRGKYELHHIEPINQGGNVYDVSNILIVTPRFHKEVLEKGFHYGN